MRPRALDLFCRAGGVSEGLLLAGFDVVGVDILDCSKAYNRGPGNPERHERPAVFVQADALTYPLAGFDFVWASPPCQPFTAYRRRPGHVGASENLIPATRERLRRSALWVIENVGGAPLIKPMRLCGSSFGLDVRRHRFFEASFELGAPPCQHATQAPRFPPATNRRNLRRTVEVGVWRIPLQTQQRAMGIAWMAMKDLSQAVPPAYAEWIGRQALLLLS